ncbi:hypothetical protein Cus16_3009 [Curtobacterium sp. ER1/6]|nr:hypothetical protein Cus16_3009 [Curtobacterium sp. ER1/6]
MTCATGTPSSAGRRPRRWRAGRRARRPDRRPADRRPRRPAERRGRRRDGPVASAQDVLRGEPAVRQGAEHRDVPELQHGVRPERVERDRVAEQVAETEPKVREQERVEPVELGELVQHLGHPGEHHRRRHRPDGHGRQCRGEQADRGQPEHRQGHAEREQDRPSGVRPPTDLRAREQRDRSDREQHGPDRRADQHDQERRRQAEGDRTGVLDEDEAHPSGRCDEQVADRAVRGLARDRVTRDDPDHERQEQRDGHRERGERHEQAVVRDVAEERRPAGVPVGGEPHRDRDEHRHEGQRAEHRPGAAPAEHQRELRAEQGERAGRASDDVRLRHRTPLR